MCCSAITCAKCCTFYSVFGFWFLMMIGILLEYQPLYIQGPEDPEKGAQACYIGAVLYLVSMALSIAYWWYDNKRAPATTAGGNLASKYGAVGNGVN